LATRPALPSIFSIRHTGAQGKWDGGRNVALNARRSARPVPSRLALAAR